MTGKSINSNCIVIRCSARHLRCKLNSFQYFYPQYPNLGECKVFNVFSILKLLNQRQLEAFKEKWWNRNPNQKNCDEYEEDSAGGISIYNIGK